MHYLVLSGLNNRNSDQLLIGSSSLQPKRKERTDDFLSTQRHKGLDYHRQNKHHFYTKLVFLENIILDLMNIR